MKPCMHNLHFEMLATQVLYIYSISNDVGAYPAL